MAEDDYTLGIVKLDRLAPLLLSLDLQQTALGLGVDRQSTALVARRRHSAMMVLHHVFLAQQVQLVACQVAFLQKLLLMVFLLHPFQILELLLI